jgi:hypothetical protein
MDTIGLHDTATPPKYKEVETELLREEIQRDSPEGRPADPKVGPGRMGWMIGIFVVVVILSAAAIGVIFDPVAGVAIGALMLLMCCMHPAIWGGVLRARERGLAKRHLTGETPDSR